MFGVVGFSILLAVTTGGPTRRSRLTAEIRLSRRPNKESTVHLVERLRIRSGIVRDDSIRSLTQPKRTGADRSAPSRFYGYYIWTIAGSRVQMAVEPRCRPKLSMKAEACRGWAHAFIKTTYDISLDSQICLLP